MALLSLPTLPAVAARGPATQLASGLLPKAPGPTCHCASLPAGPSSTGPLKREVILHHRSPAAPGSGPEEKPPTLLTRIKIKPGLWAAGHMATHRSLSRPHTGACPGSQAHQESLATQKMWLNPYSHRVLRQKCPGEWRIDISIIGRRPDYFASGQGRGEGEPAKVPRVPNLRRPLMRVCTKADSTPAESERPAVSARDTCFPHPAPSPALCHRLRSAAFFTARVGGGGSQEVPWDAHSSSISCEPN